MSKKKEKQTSKNKKQSETAAEVESPQENTATQKDNGEVPPKKLKKKLKKLINSMQ